MHKFEKRLSLFDLVKITLISLLPVIIGTGMLYLSSGAMLNTQVSNAVDEVSDDYDAIISTAYMAARKVTDIQGSPCARVIDRLRKETARQIYVRSINLLQEGKVYCSSVLTDIDDFNSEYSSFKPGVTLVPGNVITPNSPVVYFRFEDVLVVVDGRYLISPLRNFTNDLQLAFSVHGSNLYASGHVFENLINPFSVSRTNDRWDVTVLGGYPSGTQWKIITGSFLPVLLLFVFASIGLFAVLIRNALSSTIRETDILNALKRNEIIPYAQPIFDHTGTRLWGVEILARWRMAEGKMISPDIFIPIAERSNAIMEMTRSLMMQTANELRDIVQLLPEGFHVAFNISNNCLKGRTLQEACHEFNILLGNQIQLTMEMTEREPFDSSDTLKSCIVSLKETGIQLAIDDFGTAGSNLDYIREYSFDFIKIDRSYVEGVEFDQASIHIIDNIIDLAKRMGMEIIAEGIEKPSQAEYLHGKGVRYFQGYLYSKPIPITTLINKYVKPLI